MKFLPVSSFLITVCIIASCNKNTGEQQHGTNLAEFKITFLDSLTYHMVYERNADDKLASVREDIVNKGTINYMKVEYNTDGTIKTAGYYPRGEAKLSFYFDFEYNAQGQIIKRSRHDVTSNLGESYSTYAYDAAGHLVTDSTFNMVNNVLQLQYINHFTYTGNNITEAANWEMKNGTPELRGRIKYEYDNGLNPRKLVWEDYFFNEINSAISDIPLLSENNVIKDYQAKGNEPYSLYYSISYEYGSNNYPVKATGTHHTNDRRYNYRIEYSMN